MKISLISRQKFRIFLNDDEFNLLFGTELKSVVSTEKFQRDIKRLILAAAPENSFLKDCEKLSVTLRELQGGINIEITKIPRPQHTPLRLLPVFNWRLDFFDTDSMLEAFYILYQSGVKDNDVNSLYRFEDGYSAVIRTTSSIIDSLHFYCKAKCSEKEILKLQEYGRPIYNGKIIEKIGGAVAKRRTVNN